MGGPKAAGFLGVALLRALPSTSLVSLRTRSVPSLPLSPRLRHSRPRCRSRPLRRTGAHSSPGSRDARLRRGEAGVMTAPTPAAPGRPFRLSRAGANALLLRRDCDRDGLGRRSMRLRGSSTMTGASKSQPAFIKPALPRGRAGRIKQPRVRSLPGLPVGLLDPVAAPSLGFARRARGNGLRKAVGRLMGRVLVRAPMLCAPFRPSW